MPAPFPTLTQTPTPSPSPSANGSAIPSEVPSAAAAPSSIPTPATLPPKPSDSASATGSSVGSPPPAETPAPESPSATALPETTTSSLTIFYVAVSDQGKAGPMIGCGDSIVATETGPVIYASQVEAAMSGLLENKEIELGQSGLMNALAGSDLYYVSSTVSEGIVTVELTGELSSGGICDDPRIIAQLTHTAMVAAGTEEARILIDGVDIGESLSLK
ncbi:hypothetical protein [Paeniglutamicibacter sulfureus]|uniref:GerMN domain-containing protein n=1 Tax=Paeniglutamicibacter sulfureus TaxID=43666 RepID=A0ABU2BKL9_9MICC|nr:hypothetical protein [Paeniglutamicibacter sulfureus]MDR7359182.1 hypothetical protein [Paeniglutamicibacter sulfureus]